jgi:acyl-CoA synthetase (AMP-forming)/AMP-acid ligase II
MLQHTDLAAVVAGHRAGSPSAAATVCGGERWTWAELDERVGRTARWLVGLGVEPGDRVAWLAQGCHRYLELLLACARVGAVFGPLNWRQSEAEAAFVLADLEPKVVVWQEEELAPLVAVLRNGGAAADAAWVQHDDAGPDGYEAQVASAPAADRLASLAGYEPRPALALYTAAFDGRPSAALLPEASLLVQGLYGILFGGASADDVYVNSGPLFHVGTLKATLATLLAGGTNVFVRRVDPLELCETIHTERGTGAFLQPPTMEAMVEVNRDGRFDLSCLRAKAGSDAWNAMVTLDRAAQRHRSGYGQTELGGVVTFVDRERPCLGGAGRPAPFALVEVVDDHGVPVPIGEVGELVVRGPMVALGYHRRPELTTHRQRQGWHHTHDLGRREADGSLTFVGPLTRIIKSAAENIYPAEVEACLRSHPGVREAAVIGVPDDTWGQSVVAVVVADGEPLEPEALIAHCRERIASYKKPKVVHFVSTLPRSADGAVDLDELDRTFGGGGYPGGG